MHLLNTVINVYAIPTVIYMYAIPTDINVYAICTIIIVYVINLLKNHPKKDNLHGFTIKICHSYFLVRIFSSV